MASQFAEQAGGVFRVAQHAFSHAVVQQCRHRIRVGQLFCAAQQAGLELHVIGNAALDAMDLRHAAIAGDVGGLAGPGRNGAEARDHDEALAVFPALEDIAVSQQGLQAAGFILRRRRRRIDEMQKTAGNADDGRLNFLQFG